MVKQKRGRPIRNANSKHSPKTKKAPKRKHQQTKTLTKSSNEKQKSFRSWNPTQDILNEFGIVLDKENCSKDEKYAAWRKYQRLRWQGKRNTNCKCFSLLFGDERNRTVSDLIFLLFIGFDYQFVHQEILFGLPRRLSCLNILLLFKKNWMQLVFHLIVIVREFVNGENV